MKCHAKRSRRTSSCTVATVAALTIANSIGGVVRATSDFHNNHPQHFPSSYVYNEFHLLSDNDDEEHEHYLSFSDIIYSSQQEHESSSLLPNFQFSTTSDADWSDFSSEDDTTSIIASSLLYEDDGCYVSSQAIMCQGGGIGCDDATTVENGTFRPTTQDSSMDTVPYTLAAMLQDMYENFWLNEDDNKEEDGEDDEDGDDDGHSSMLSNASLRRHSKIVKRTTCTRCYAGGGTKTCASNDNEALMSTARLSSRQLHAFLQRRSKSESSYFSNALQIRGGGSSTDTAAVELTKRLINAAIVTLVFEAVIGHILEFVKIVMQTAPPGTTYTSVYRDITNEKGIGGLWDGFVPWGVLQAVLKGGVFGLAYRFAEKLLVPLAKEGNMPMKLAMTLAGGIAGGFQGFVLSPTLLMKTRVMTNEVFRESMSLWETTWKSMVIGGDIIKEEGFGSIMKGANTFAIKRVFDWASRYFFADMFESVFVHMKGVPLSVSERSVASLLGGVASTVLTLPLDVLVAKTQDAKKAGVKVSAWKLFSDELNQEGWSGLQKNYMKGFEARLLHVCLTTVVMKTMEPIVYKMIFGS